MINLCLVLFSAPLICIFLTNRLQTLTAAVFGQSDTLISFIICAALVVICAALAIRKRALASFDKNRLPLFICLAVGIVAGFSANGILGANGILSKIGAGLLVGWYLLLLFAWLPHIRRFHKPTIHTQLILFLLCAAVLVNFIGAVYIAQSSSIYYWDNAIYWIFSRDIAGGSLSEHFLTNLYDSIVHFDYNYLAALLSALFAYLFGDSRLVYILSILNCYYIPFAALCYFLAKRTVRPIITSCILLLLYPAVLYLGLCGFVDIAGLVICTGCFVLYFSEKQTPSKALAISFLLVLAMLMRRWYAFFAVSFLIAVFADILFSRRKAVYALIMLLHTGFLLLMFFGAFVTEKLLTDYSALYAGYQFSLSTDFKLICRYFGIIPLALLLTGSIWTFIKRDKRPFMPLIQMTVCFLLFVHTQTHGQQHLLLYLPALIVLTSIALTHISKQIIPVVLALSIAVSANTLIDRPQPSSLTEISSYALIPSFSLHPGKRTDIKQILALKSYLDTLTEDGGKVGVLASSFVLNKDILENVEMSFNIEDPVSRDYFISLPAVDSRDTDLSPFYEADYMMTASPIQTHLAPKNQRVVTVPSESFANGTDIAAAYEKLDVQFKVDDVSVQIYRRTRENTEEEIKAFESKLR